MAGAYSTDLRERVLTAIEAGEAPEAAARRFAVGRSTAYRWMAAAHNEGRREAKRMGGGPKPLITGKVEAALRRTDTVIAPEAPPTLDAAGGQTFCMGRSTSCVASTVRGRRSMASVASATSSGWIRRSGG
jgi:Transposase